MRFKILLPSEIYLDQEVSKVIAEANNGSFCLLPRHIDFVAALAPGLLSIEDEKGQEVFMAVDEGILVKKGQDVSVSTRNVVTIPNLGQLREVIEEKFKVIDDREKAARTAAARLEADLVRRLMELRKA
ncbi:MAG TPA: F0F1 ATP synthase subunit epsilon [Deltaproteobacteria bacterium]|nr:F0F1 ATP synthase subunit epsilon [Deltaproteobacteria bacterium]HPJ93660.1 F0F1 ATP synthase subunit epsilon [Deltaproteobacteria bacterium]HPR50606.1 F0F1 ATP synthase subunit epsilon [Deltaproteobacteria bacterium]